MRKLFSDICIKELPHNTTLHTHIPNIGQEYMALFVLARKQSFILI